MAEVVVEPAPIAVDAATYSEVVKKNIFSSDRNPKPGVDTDYPVVVMPPPLLPPLPVLRGVVRLPSGVVALIGENIVSRDKAYGLGEMVGPFKLISIATDEVGLQWMERIITVPITRDYAFHRE